MEKKVIVTVTATPETHQSNSSISGVTLHVLGKTSTKTRKSRLRLAVASRRLHSIEQFKETLVEEEKESFLVMRSVPSFMEHTKPFHEKDIAVRV